jgi:hypothetical protein
MAMQFNEEFRSKVIPPITIRIPMPPGVIPPAKPASPAPTPSAK